MSLYLAYIVLLITLRAEADPVGKKCPPTGHGKPSCVCNDPAGVIDLTPLSKQGSPMFTGLTDSSSFSYEYNPCSTFSDGTACTDVYICQSLSTDQYPIANKGTEAIYIDVSDTYVYYSSPTGDGAVREAKVHLVCNKTLTTGKELITSDGEKTKLLYEFTLTSCHACPGGCSGGGGSIAGPIGIVLIFLGIIALITYFIVGTVIMKVRFNASGSDIIPNKGFWFVLPLLIKDGCAFTISPCMKRIRNKSDYNEI